MATLASSYYMKERKRLYLSMCIGQTKLTKLFRTLMYVLQNIFVIGNLLALSVGLSFAWSSPMLPKLLHAERVDSNPLGRLITSEEASWIGSFMAFGAMFGTFLAGFIAAKFGRKRSLLIGCALPFVVGNVMVALAKTVYLFYTGRIVIGVAVSGVYTVVPMYLSEIAEDEIRGRICSSMLTFETFGELATYCAGPYISIPWFSIITIATTTIAAMVILTLLPESPYFLLSVGNRGDAEKSLLKLRSSPIEAVREELDLMQDTVEKSKAEHGRVTDLFRTKASRRAEVTTMTLMILQHFSGIVPILFYSQSIFDETGSSLPPEICPMIFGVVQFFSSFVAPSLVDTLGRRWMLFISAFGMLLADFFLGLYFFMKGGGHDVTIFFWLPVLCLAIYIFSYVTGFGPLIWTVMGEMFPSNLKAPAFTIGVCFWWIMAFTLSRIFHPIAAAIGMVGAFWIFAGDCFLAIIFILSYVIETKGKSFQEIQDILNK